MCASGFPGKWLIKPCPCNLCSLQCKRLWGQRIGKGGMGGHGLLVRGPWRALGHEALPLPQGCQLWSL